MIAECAEDGHGGSFGELLQELLICLPDELLAVVPGGLLNRFAIGIGVVTFGGNRKGDYLVSFFEGDDFGIVSEISAGEYFCFHDFYVF